METQWNPLASDWIKLNIVAAFDNSKGVWTVVARNYDSSFSGCGIMAHEVMSPIEAETRGVLLVVEFAVLFKLQKVVIESGAETMVRMLTTTNGHIPWRLQHLIFEI